MVSSSGQQNPERMGRGRGKGKKRRFTEYNCLVDILYASEIFRGKYHPYLRGLKKEKILKWVLMTFTHFMILHSFSSQ